MGQQVVERRAFRDALSAVPMGAIEMAITAIAKEERPCGIHTTCATPGMLDVELGLRMLVLKHAGPVTEPFAAMCCCNPSEAQTISLNRFGIVKSSRGSRISR